VFSLKKECKLINIVVCKINKTQKEHANAFSKNRPIHSVKTYQLTQIAAKQKPRTALVAKPVHNFPVNQLESLKIVNLMMLNDTVYVSLADQLSLTRKKQSMYVNIPPFVHFCHLFSPAFAFLCRIRFSLQNPLADFLLYRFSYVILRFLDQLNSCKIRACKPAMKGTSNE
jgi:hypothetical protein